MIETGEERRQAAIAVAQQALGALHHLSPTRMLADVGGRSVELVLRSASTARFDGGDPNQILELRFPLSVPIRFAIHERSSYIHVGPVPCVATGDPGFDANWTVVAVPVEVVQRALDGPTRAWMQQHAGEHLMLQTDEWGALGFFHSISLPRENPRRPLTPQVISAAATALSHFASALETAYHARRAELVAEGGEAGALLWEEGNKQVVAARPLGWVRWVLAVCLLLALVVILVTVAIFVFVAMRLTG